MNDYERGRILERINHLLKLDDKLLSQLLLQKHVCTAKVVADGGLHTEPMYGGRVNVTTTADLLSYITGIDLELSMREDGTIRKIHGKSIEEMND